MIKSWEHHGKIVDDAKLSDGFKRFEAKPGHLSTIVSAAVEAAHDQKTKLAVRLSDGTDVKVLPTDIDNGFDGTEKVLVAHRQYLEDAGYKGEFPLAAAKAHHEARRAEPIFIEANEFATKFMKSAPRGAGNTDIADEGAKVARAK